MEAHISLAAVYYRLQRKADGDREKALAQKLTLEQRTAPVSGEDRMKRALLPLAAATCAVWLLALAPARPAPTATRPGFVDVAPKSKIPYTTQNSFAGRKYFPQPMCGGVAAFDFDNDGRTDIFFTNGAKLPEMKKTDASYFNCLLRQKSDGTFEDVTAKAGLTGEQLDFNLGVAVGDYDNDGYEDLFVCSIGRNVLYHNNGDGTFTDVTAASGIGGKPADTLSIAAAWFDYDNDGLLDLIVSNYTIWTPKTDARCMMSDKDYYCDPRRYPSVPSRLYRNLGKGKFEDVTAKSGFAAAPGKGMGVSIADFNDDGWMDVFIANDTEPNALFINQKNGTFEEKGLELGVAYNENAQVGSSMGSDAKDFNNDGKVDIFYNNLMGQVWQLLRNRGDLFEYYLLALEDPEAEHALLGLEQRLHRLQQRRLEGHLLRQRRRGHGERQVAAARHDVRERGRQVVCGRLR